MTLKPIAHEKRRVNLRRRIRLHFLVVAVVMGGSLLIGILGFTTIAGLSLVDGFLEAAMLLGGMGPVATMVTTAAKIWSGCYALYAGIVFLASVGYLVTPLLHHLLIKFRVEDLE